MIRCSIAPSAIRDLDDISDYFLERNIKAGEQLIISLSYNSLNTTLAPEILLTDDE